MAFDQPTRNRLQKFVSEARSLLTVEFTRQLQNDYGLDPESGNISPIEVLTGLDDERLSTAKILRETFNHYQSTSPSENTKDLLERIVREQAFTMLNRFAAIRMAEARGILFESISDGYQSKGFQLYSRVAGSGLGSTFDAYRNYIFSVFDELALDLAVLFDRFSPFGRLFPRQAALEELLGLLNDREIDHLWGEDETIGWIYQYFNSKEERKKMRDASAAPRNSRELAVRNQFFTPRYVVEFLTDNTLGRIWYEMTQGETSLVDKCRYLVRRANEIFLAKGENALLLENEGSNENLPQEERLKQPVYVTHRPLKDPREILMLDPACGSMHFGLYAFDLFMTIYEESWVLEEVGGANALRRQKQLKSLHETYENDKGQFLRDVPRLIIENNIHGIDIDPRAVQIAGLSLWLRAQRSWAEQSFKSIDRPQIRRSNIVCAEPMPGEADLLEEFITKHFTDTPEKRLLGEFVRRIFDSMRLAGEAGSLLKIEAEVANVISESRERWHKLQQQKQTEHPELFEGARVNVQPGFDFEVGDITDENFWDRAEREIYKALRYYSEVSEDGAGYKRRLFADDAAQGFAFIDLCRKHYDAVLMNPPFGEFSKKWKSQAAVSYPNSSNDVLAAFIDSFIHRLNYKGRLGAITSRTCFFLTSFASWRLEVVLSDAALSLVADLGQGVMDDAMVEAAAYVLERSGPTAITPFIRAITDRDREMAIASCVAALNSGVDERQVLFARQETFHLLPNSPFVYWVGAKELNHFVCLPAFEPKLGKVRQGLATGDDGRFVRTVWEVPPENTQFVYYPSNLEGFCSFDDENVQAYFRRRAVGESRWAFHVKAGASQPWYSPITLKINWAEDGAELRHFVDVNGKLRSRPQNVAFYYRPGFSWTRRAVRFYPYVIPGNCIPSVSRYMTFPETGREVESLGLAASRLGSAFMRFYGEKFEWPNFLVDNVKMLPCPDIDGGTKKLFEELIVTQVERRRRAYQNHEPFHDFLLPTKIKDFSGNGESFAFDPVSILGEEGERRVAEAYGFTSEEAGQVERDLLEAIHYQRGTDSNGSNEYEEDEDSDFVIDLSEYAKTEATISYALGCAFGRWDIDFATGQKQYPALPDTFAPLPVCPPGMLQNAKGLPASLEDVTVDYPLKIVWGGILVDDAGNASDVENHLRKVLDVIWKERSEAIETEACEVLGVRSLRDYFRRPGGFFADHLKRYTKSRRQAPIYLPLSTKSGDYTLWLYYHRLTDQILYTCVNDFVEPKLRQVKDEGANLGSKQGRSRDDEKRLEHLTELAFELEELRDELLRLAPVWKPNLNDGVQITVSPLWKLFRFPKWRKTLEDTWKKLEKGDYDWAHLAYSFSPERVREKCRHDKSLAIAHDLEDLYEERPAKTRKTRTKQAQTASLPLADG